MATTRKSTKSTKPAVAVEEAEVETATEPSVKQTVNAGIARVAEELGVEAKDRYKVQRAIGFIAMQQAIEDGTFDELLDATVAGVADLPAGFGLERTVAAPKAPAKAKAAPKAVAKKAPAKSTAKATARKRPTR
jgi:hypothetical protein